MTTVDATARFERPSLSDAILKGAATFWFVVAVVGQWAFVAYIVIFFYPPTLQGNFEAWDKNKLLFHGFVPGDTIGNLGFAAHVLMAAIITFGGTLQLIPQIRARAISFHRWNGRLFILTAFAISLAGLLLHLTRGHPSTNGFVGIGLNAVLIMFCAAQAFGFALARDIDTHRRWALRTFMVVNGVWFLRVGAFAWIILTQGSLKTMGPFINFWVFGSYLVPLAVLELYLLAENRGGPLSKVAMAVLLIGLTAVMGVGIFATSAFLWWPLIAS